MAENEIIINGEGMVAGRLAAIAAKKALLGFDVNIINSEKALIVGNKKEIIKRYKIKEDRGIPSKGPFLPKRPDRFLRKIIRGMLPYKKSRGRNAYKQVKCFIGMPEEFKDKKITEYDNAHIKKSKHTEFITIKEILKNLGSDFE
jgi:large subunit ribosomal protein L13